MIRRAVNRKTREVIKVNTAAFSTLESEIQITLIRFLHDIIDVETIEGINLALRQISEQLNLNTWPIVDPVSGRFIWGLEPIRIDFNTGELYVEYLHRRS